MTDYGLGRAIRAALDQQELTTDQPADPRSVETRLPQLVRADQQDLLPALSFLLRSRALASALAQPRGSDDGRIAVRLQAEVQAQYSLAICQRLQEVIEGLTGMPQQPLQPPVQQQLVSQPALITLVASNNGKGWVVALLCFLIGIVGSGLLLVLWLQQEQQNKKPATTTTEAPAVAGGPAPLPVTSPAPTTPPAPTMPLGTDAINSAVASIQELYAALSAKDYTMASNHFGPVAADQFEPAFFNQFERVMVADLRETSHTGSMINFYGVVTFVYTNGDVQTESRVFTVDTRTTPPLITSSEFVRVLQSR